MRTASNATTATGVLVPAGPPPPLDTTTGLPDRLSLLTSAAELRRDGTPAALLVLDIDDFSSVNLSLGTSAGDAVLEVIAERLQQQLRGADTLTRLGDDEFAVLCPGIDDASQAARLAERLLDAFTEPIDLDPHRVAVSAKIGVAVADGECDADLLLRRALLSLRQAKHGGRDRMGIDDDPRRSELSRRLRLAGSLRAAVEADELTLAYQPLVDLRTGRICSAEALLRWTHPELGPVSPGLLVELAEVTGLIRCLGDWVLRTACRQLGAWRADGGGPPALSVNVSALQLTDPGFAPRLGDILAAYDVPAASLCLEVTEGVLIAADGPETAVLAEVQALGVRVAIDDFGTGYSSLAYLKQLPVDVVKIAREFVAGMTGDHRDAAIVSAIVHLTDALGLAVVAEGVETAAQRDALIDLGCEVAQGFFLGLPEPCPA